MSRPRWLAPADTLATLEGLADDIRLSLVTGHFRAGAELTTHWLSHQYRVSTELLDAALHRVTEEGYLDRVGTSSVVPDLSASEIARTHAVRAHLEPDIVRASCLAITTGAIERLKSLLITINNPALSTKDRYGPNKELRSLIMGPDLDGWNYRALTIARQPLERYLNAGFAASHTLRLQGLSWLRRSGLDLVDAYQRRSPKDAKKARAAHREQMEEITAWALREK